MKRNFPLLLSALACALLTFRTPLLGQDVLPLTTLHEFGALDGNNANPDGATPESELVQGSDGNFYGTASHGGSGGSGTVFTLTPAGAFTTLHSFTSAAADGYYPYAGLVQGRDGNFYGGTNLGGTGSFGTAFKITPAGKLTVLYNFTGRDVQYLQDALIQGRDGSFYGAADGGLQGVGAAFKITPAGKFTLLTNFDYNSGSGPNGLIQGRDGNFYGTTESGGTNGFGTVYKIDPTGEHTRLYSFAREGTSGYDPAAGLVQDANGDFYGTTYTGGSGDTGYNGGTVFKVTPAGVLTTLHHFTAASKNAQAAPYAALIRGPGGSFYGTTSGGGDHGLGSVFRITPAGEYTKLYSFTGGADGKRPHGALLLGTDGNFYGTTSQGGSNGTGTVFRLGSNQPVILSAATAKGTLGTKFTYQIAATGVPTRFAVEGMGGQMHVDAGTGVISGYPLGAGTHTLTLHAFNAAGEGTQTLLLTIDHEAPVITSPTTASAVEGQAFSYQITADNGPSQFQVLRLSPGLHVDAESGLLSGTPTASGAFKLTLKAVNGRGTGTATLKLTVAPP